MEKRVISPMFECDVAHLCCHQGYWNGRSWAEFARTLIFRKDWRDEKWMMQDMESIEHCMEKYAGLPYSSFHHRA